MARILMVEDDTGLGDSISRALDAHGHDVTWALDLAAARQAAADDEFDVVLCDWAFPDAPGGLKNKPNGAVFLNEFLPAHRLCKAILWSGLDRRREARELMPVPPDAIMLKDLATSVLDRINEYAAAAGRAGAVR
jgi:DNA-binding NarL/FixJ family response regulator